MGSESRFEWSETTQADMKNVHSFSSKAGSELWLGRQMPDNHFRELLFFPMLSPRFNGTLLAYIRISPTFVDHSLSEETTFFFPYFIFAFFCAELHISPGSDCSAVSPFKQAGSRRNIFLLANYRFQLLQ